MTAPSTVARTLLHPGAALSSVPSRRVLALALAAATLASVASAAVVVPRTDYARAADLQLSARPDAAEMTPFAREEAIATDVKVARIGAWAKALFIPALRAAAIALAAFVAFRIAAGIPTLVDAMAVASLAVLPLGLRDLLAIPAALARGLVPPPEAGKLLPSSLGALLPPGAPRPLASAAGGVDLFGVWCAVLLAIGMAAAARVSPRRSAIVVALLFVAVVAVGDVALPALAPRPS